MVAIRSWTCFVLVCVLGLIAAISAAAQSPQAAGLAQGSATSFGRHLKIKSFSVATTDNVLSYPSYFTGLDLPDEHSSLLPLWPWAGGAPDRGRTPYLLFTSSKVTASGMDGTVALETTDLTNFFPATALGYAEQVMSAPVVFNTCDGTHDLEFDENYAGAGSVLQGPTLPPGNLIMLYEAENHCPGGTHQENFYATVGFARSSDNGRTWPAPVNSEFGNFARHPVLKASVDEPATTFPVALGDAIPSGFVDISALGEAYLYVTYTYHDGETGDPGLSIRVARARLGNIYRGFGNGWAPPLQFWKWYNGGFTQPGIGGLDSAVFPSTQCLGVTRMSEITRNDDLGLYMLIFVCSPSSVTSTGERMAAWYYSTATSLELQDWTAPQPIAGSESAFPSCPSSSGQVFDGFYPSFISPGAPAGHTRLTGLAFFLNGCDTGQPRALSSRSFTITVEP